MQASAITTTTSTIDLFPPLVYEEDLTPDCGIEIDDVCKDIRDAVKGWGSDKAKLISSLGSTTPEDRLKISLRYNELFDKRLKDVIQKETSGDFGTGMKYLSLNPIQAECAMIKDACKGIGSNATILYSILCGRSTKDMNLLKKTYYKTYTKDLTSLLSSELSGDNWKLTSACLQASEEPYDPDYHTMEKAEEDAEMLWKKGQGKWFGTDEKAIFKIIVLAPTNYLAMVNLAYAEKYGYTLLKAMEKQLSGNGRKATLFHLKAKLKPYEAMAELIKSACAGIGTDELLLTTCIIRYQDVLGQVNFAHEDLFGKSIQDRIRSECSGNYKALLLALVNKVCPEMI